MRRLHWLMLIVAFSFSLLVSGCASEKPLQINRRLTSLRMVSKKPPDAEYVVDPPDVLQLEFSNMEEQGRTARLRQDGTITLPLLREVKVAGMTPEEIRKKLETQYAQYYKDPQVLVSVAQHASKFVFIYGEVGRQGRVPYSGYTTVSDLIGQVGGVSRRAAIGRVKVIRGDPDDTEVFSVDLDELVMEGNVWQNVSLAENDVVYVPPTIPAWIGYQIEAVLFPFRSVLGAAATAEGFEDIGDDDDDHN